MCHLLARMLDDGCIDQFLRYHLPRCDCPGGALRTPRELHAALVPLLAILRARNVIAQPPPPASPIALWLGHEGPTTTHQYVEANLAMKEKALAKSCSTHERRSLGHLRCRKAQPQPVRGLELG